MGEVIVKDARAIERSIAPASFRRQKSAPKIRATEERIVPSATAG